MKSLRFLCLGAIAASVLCGFAEVKWLNTRHDFGTWAEADGLREGKARFVNTGKSDVIIRHVRPSCGCTGVEWTREPIAPGDTGIIVFNYNPAGRPGRFHKTIRVMLDTARTADIIEIFGTVVGDSTTLRHRYPVGLGPLRLSQAVVDFGDVTWGTSRHFSISTYNSSNFPLTPEVLEIERDNQTLPIEAILIPATVEAGQSQSLSIYLNSSTAPQLGPLTTRQTICLGDTCMDLLFKAKIVPPAASATAEEVAIAPRADIKNDVINLGKVKPGKKVKVEFEITNSGASDLQLKRVYSQFPQLVINKFPMRLAPGKKGKVEAEINTRALETDVLSGMIEIITNDPLRPLQSVRFAGLLRK